MKKISIILILLLCIPSFAGAHSHLETSFPAEGEVVTEQLEEVRLDFSAGIEEGSTMTLGSQQGNFDFTDVTVSDNTLTGTVPEGLTDDSYIVEWSVISEDGHPLEGEFAFELQIGSEEEAAEEPATEEAAEPGENQTSSPFDNATAEQETNEAGAFSPFIIIVPILIVALVGGFFVIRRNR